MKMGDVLFVLSLSLSLSLSHISQVARKCIFGYTLRVGWSVASLSDYDPKAHV